MTASMASAISSAAKLGPMTLPGVVVPDSVEPSLPPSVSWYPVSYTHLTLPTNREV